MNIKSYKKTVWKSCASYVKYRESDSFGKVKCVTCNKILSIYDQECNAGHFISGRGNMVLFDDPHIFPQCNCCNLQGAGEQYKYAQFLRLKYGYDDNAIDEIRSMRHKTKKYTIDELKLIKYNYEKRISLIKTEKGLK